MSKLANLFHTAASSQLNPGINTAIDRTVKPETLKPRLARSPLMLRVVATLTMLCLAESAVAKPLQPGTYWGGGSRYITIMRQGSDRMCYMGSSHPNKAVVASIFPVRENPKLYSVYGVGRIALLQQDEKTLLFGALSDRRTALMRASAYRMEGSRALTEELKQCLNARKPFYKQIVSSR
ncbi:MAG: hypothetical protein KME42_17760 [Tildeniella nuda ZEHNDER 1965/U140]|jgi:hypothetical protein|nr:hypothetical protein [Tildeniella nuda ZEHNDER 1965/U140]